MFAIGGIGGGSDVEAYDFHAAKWNQMPSLPSRRYDLGAATLNGKVYAIGGEDGRGNILETVDVFDPFAQNWASAPNMKYKREYFGVGVSDGKIYVIGGWSGSQRLNSVEMFDGERWTDIGQGMNKKRWGVAAGVLNGNIYAVGGYDGKVLKTVEKMNPATGVWGSVASMNTATHAHCVAVLDGKLYAIGGYDGGVLKSVEIYDPDLDRWTFVADLNNPREYAGAGTGIKSMSLVVGLVVLSIPPTSTIHKPGYGRSCRQKCLQAMLSHYFECFSNK